MGGQASTTNTINMSTDVLSKVATSMLATQQINSGQDQVIDIEGGNGNVDISNNDQVMQSHLNLTGLSKMMATQTAQQQVVQQLSQAAASSTSGVNLGNSSNANNDINDMMNVTLDVSTKIGQICTTNSMQSQTIEVKNHNGNVEVTGNTQSEIQNVIANCVMNATSTQVTLQKASADLTQTAIAKTVGFDFTELIILLLLLLLAPLIMVGAPLALGASTAAGIIMKFMGPIMFLSGIGVLLWYEFMILPMNKTFMQGTQFSTLIANDPTCGAVPFDIAGMPPAAPPSSGSAPSSGPEPLSANQLTTASNLCLANSDCMGLDWDANLARVTFYKGMTGTVKDVCPGVKQVNASNLNFVHNSILYLRSGVDPTVVNAVDTVSGAKFHDTTQFLKTDVVLDTASGQAYWKMSDDVEPQWQGIGQLPLWKAGATITQRTGVPDDTVGTTGSIWIDTQPLSWTIYVRDGKTYHADEGGTVWTPDYATQQSLSFPGRNAMMKSPENYNWSGYKIHQTVSQYMLILGIVLVVLGTFLTIGGFWMNRKAAAAPPASIPLSSSSSSSASSTAK